MMRRAARLMRDWPRGVRWLVAELIPFGCLFLGMLLVWAGIGPVGFILALFGGVIATVWYLNWVQDTHATWVFPLIGLLLPATIVGESIFGHSALSKGHPLVVTPAYWQAFGGLLAALAITVALAVMNGERHRGRYSYIVTAMTDKAPRR
jgi:hypothetical protein